MEDKRFKHGMSKHPIYTAWRHMKGPIVDGLLVRNNEEINVNDVNSKEQFLLRA